jgi:nucleoid-associated protein YgaU
MTLENKLERVELALTRWHTRLTRASNTIRKLERQRRRLVTRRAAPAKLPAPAKPVPTPMVPAVPADDLDIRNQGWLDRKGNVTQAAENELKAVKASKAADEKAKAEILAAQADRQKQKKAASKAKSKAKLAGDLRKMPLQGKEALAAIRG